jgi:hypothetical protein
MTSKSESKMCAWTGTSGLVISQLVTWCGVGSTSQYCISLEYFVVHDINSVIDVHTSEAVLLWNTLKRG